MLYKKKFPLVIFLIPGLILIFLFLYWPFIENIKNSFYDITNFVKMPGKEWTFIGVENYKKLLTDSKLRIAFANSIKMMGLAVVFQVGIALGLAIFVSWLRRGENFFRTIYFFPIVISATAIGLIFKLFYNYSGGMLNQFLEVIGKDPVNWLAPGRAFTMIAIPIIWSYVGFYFVILLTGLNAIPEELYEAAKVDGCSKVKQVLYVTLPMMRGVFCTCIILAVTGALKVFDLPWVIAPKGAPQGRTHFLGTLMYEQTFTIGNVDYGSAIGFVIVIFGLLVSLAVNELLKPDANL
ncbi:carbohydrate ABC transporter permease [Anaerocolumna xylanovorans]|uniref:Raffinose/stachyose/melibiose transport system permease protein n=1 Tax=Anaerocolumna xylanovorans DSM 12503 TaxID=1121345 RepID=A0A1M7YGL9_9FIRM|nr:sugar ABC transporter permease [Anaerocolumna xylanovorans]SHO51782.1 raffinose/stachyose/melibiose transport system permease protein [Anaerocolumna xylanovorans DSM 12503]